MGSMEAARPETAIMAAMAKKKLTGSKGDIW
jgi:hypothetical protein